MATRTSQPTEELGCSVCLESFKDPKVLPCCHSFCLQCLQNTLQRTKDKTKLTCPQCRTEHEVPSNGINGFLNDYTVYNDQQREVKKSSKPTCQQCARGNVAVSYCHTCTDLCKECLEAHKQLKIFKTHEILSSQECKSSIRIKKTYYCTVHPEETLKLYCTTCKSLACLLCFVSSHNGHDVGSTDKKAREEVKQNIASLLQQSSAQLEMFQANLQRIKALEEKKTEVFAPLKTKINKRIDTLITEFEEKRKQLLKEADESIAAELKELWAEKEFHETAIAGLQGALSFAKRILNCEDTELLALCSQITTRLEALNSTKLECSTAEKLENTEVVFNEGKQVSYISDFAGSIHIEDYNLEIITHIHNSYYCDDIISFTVTLKTKKRQTAVRRTMRDLPRNPAFTLTAEVSGPSPDYVGHNCSIQKSGWGGKNTCKWTVSFYAQEVGSYSITLKANSTYRKRTITQEKSVQCNVVQDSD